MKDDFPKIRAVNKRIPWGYYKSNTDEGLCIADEKALEKLSECFDYLDKGMSLRKAKEWMDGQGYDISFMGLKKLWDKHRPDSIIKLQREKEKRKQQKSLVKNPLLSKEKQEFLKKSKEIASIKRSITNKQKKLERLESLKQNKIDKMDEIKEIKKSSVVDSINILKKEEIEKEREVVFKPHEGPQSKFLAAPELEVLFGGAAGGGKSVGLIADPLRYVENKNFVGLVLRRTNDELRELIWKTKELYPQVYKESRFSEKASEWRFPSGARLWMSYLDRDDDVLRYQGQAYTWVGFDELTHWPTPYPWNYLRSRLRTTKGSGLENSLSMRATTNPGGPGHSWVKKMFIDPAPPNVSFWATDIETGEVLKDPETNLPLFKRKFIPATLKDNPSLWEDGNYRRNLLSLPEGRRRQLLDGDWTISDGAAFPEFSLKTHVIEPFDIGPEWTKFRSCDYGYSSYTCVLWFAVNPNNNDLVVYRELYVSKQTPESLAEIILNLERKDRIKYGVLDSSVWFRRGEGPSEAERMILKGVSWRKSDRSKGSRTAGKTRLHELLKINENTGKPGILFFNTCRQIVSDLQVIPQDPEGNDDIDPRFSSDHSYDALRYGIMSRPMSDPFWSIDSFKKESFSFKAPADRIFGY